MENSVEPWECSYPWIRIPKLKLKGFMRYDRTNKQTDSHCHTLYVKIKYAILVSEKLIIRTKILFHPYTIFKHVELWVS